MNRLVEIFVGLGALVFAQAVYAYPVDRAENGPVYPYGFAYIPGDDITNRGGITFSSNGLGAWHAGLPSPHTSRSGDLAITDDPVFPILPMTGSVAEFDPGEQIVATSAARQLPEPASWALLLPMLLFLSAPRRSVRFRRRVVQDSPRAQWRNCSGACKNHRDVVS